MHTSVLVPIEKFTISADEAREITQKAIEYYSNNSQQGIEDSWLLQYVKSHATEFSASVNKAVDDILSPYHANLEDPKYMLFEDGTEQLKCEYNTGTTTAIELRGKYYDPCDLPSFKVCEDGVIREKSKDGKLFLSHKAQQMVYHDALPNTTRYKSFRAFAKDCAVYCPEQKAWGSYYNPNSYLDAYTIGGRWSQSLLVKDTVTDCMQGVAARGLKPRKAPSGYKWVDAARIKDIEFDEMARQEEALIRQNHAKYQSIWNGAKPDETDPLTRHLEQKADGLYYARTKVYDPTVDVETLVKEADCCAENQLAKLFYAYVDTDADLPEESGYYDKEWVEESDESWTTKVNDFVQSFEPDTVLVVVDCHS